MSARPPPFSIGARIGAGMLGLFVVLGIIGPWIAPYDPAHLALGNQFAAPSGTHWLGTDSNGIDALSQLLWGARSALTVSLLVVAISATVGVTIGTIAGYFGGWVDEVIMRIVDILMAFPGILLNITVVALLAAPGLGVMIFALTINGWVGYARVARGQTLSVREREYVQAAKAVGASSPRIIARHIIPNLMAPVIVQMTFGFGSVILVEAALSFLGLGPQVDYTWGAMLEQGRTFLLRSDFAHYVIAPGAAIAWVVLSANLLGDGLRDRLDPRQRGRA